MMGLSIIKKGDDDGATGEEPGASLARGSLGVIIVVALLVASLPIIMTYTTLVLTSFANTIVSNPWVKFEFTVENWRLFMEGKLAPTSAIIYTTTDIIKIVVNTGIVAFGVMLVVLASSVTSAYAFSRMKFMWRAGMMKLLIVLHAFPGVALIVGVYAIYVFIKTYIPRDYDVYYAYVFVILARASLEIPMAIWILKGFFDKVPWELEWATLVDGGSRFTALRHAVLPIVKPGIAAIAIFAFLAGWEDLIYVLVFLPPQQKTLATYIESQLGSGSLETTYLPVVAAAGTLYLIPTIAFFVFTQKLLLETMSGGLKG